MQPAYTLDLPPELQHVADLLSEQPPEVRELFRYALVLAMIDDEKAWVTGTRLVESREYLTVRTVAGDQSEIMRPAISEEMELLLKEQLRAIIAEDESSRSKEPPPEAAP